MSSLFCCRSHRAIWEIYFCNAAWMRQQMFDKVLLPFLEIFLGLTANHHSSYIEISFHLIKYWTLSVVLGLPNTFASTPSRIPYCCSKATGKHILLSICCYHYLDASHTTLLQSPQSVKDAVSVANNACWAIGELAIKVCAYFYTFLLNPAAPNSFSKHRIPFFFFTAAKFKPFGMGFLLVHVTYKCALAHHRGHLLCAHFIGICEISYTCDGFFVSRLAKK